MLKSKQTLSGLFTVLDSVMPLLSDPDEILLLKRLRAKDVDEQDKLWAAVEYLFLDAKASGSTGVFAINLATILYEQYKSQGRVLVTKLLTQSPGSIDCAVHLIENVEDVAFFNTTLTKLANSDELPEWLRETIRDALEDAS